jgi:hypothetical protein
MQVALPHSLFLISREINLARQDGWLDRASDSPYRVASGGIGMSRKAVAITLLAYFLAALAYGLFIEMQRPLSTLNLGPDFVGSVVGQAIGVFALGGLLPLVGWAFLRFRAERAVGPMIVWAVLSVGVMYFNALGLKWEQEQEIATLLGKVAVAGRDRDDFVRIAKRFCIDRQAESQLNRQSGATTAQIDAYCDCFADGMLKLMTADDFWFFVSNGKPSTDLQTRIDRFAQTCSRSAMGG